MGTYVILSTLRFLINKIGRQVLVWVSSMFVLQSGLRTESIFHSPAIPLSATAFPKNELYCFSIKTTSC